MGLVTGTEQLLIFHMPKTLTNMFSMCYLMLLSKLLCNMMFSIELICGEHMPPLMKGLEKLGISWRIEAAPKVNRETKFNFKLGSFFPYINRLH